MITRTLKVEESPGTPRGGTGHEHENEERNENDNDNDHEHGNGNHKGHLTPPFCAIINETEMKGIVLGS